MAQGGGVASVRKGLQWRSEIGAPKVLLQSGVEKEVARCDGEYIFTLRMAGIQKVVRLLLYQNGWHLQNSGTFGAKPFSPGLARCAGWQGLIPTAWQCCNFFN